MYEGKKISLVIGTYREKKSIRKIINDFYNLNLVDEFIIVNNNAQKGTDEEIRKTNAYKKGLIKIIYEKRQGYGYAYKTGMLNATGDYIVNSEADSTFNGSDLMRFLVYAKDFDVVFGTRTRLIRSLSGRAGMRVSRKFANVLEAKSIEFLFNSYTLTDVGCTYKLFTKKALNKIKLLWGTSGSALFNTELVLLTAALNLNFVEIPISYNKRIGTSQIVGKWYQIAKWAIIIQLYILIFWIDSKINSQKYKQ